MSSLRHLGKSIAALGCGALLLSACSGGGQADGAEDSKPPVLNQEELDELLSAVAAAHNIQPELFDLRDRLNLMCMEEAGFETHPGAYIYEPIEYSADTDSLAGDPPEVNSGYLPTVEHATEFGFDRDPDAPDDKGTTVDTGFDDQPQDYQNRYWATMMGARYIESMAGKGVEVPDGFVPDGPGCEEQTAEALYGSLETAVPAGESDPDSEHHSDLISLPPPKAIDPYTSVEAYETSPKRSAAFEEWAHCVEAEGHPYFEVGEGGDFEKIGNYLELFTNTADKGDEGRYDGLTPPKGSPFGEDEAAEKKKEFAVVVAECAEQVGLVDTLRAEWGAAMITTLSAAEVEIFAWYNDMQLALENGQKALEA